MAKAVRGAIFFTALISWYRVENDSVVNFCRKKSPENLVGNQKPTTFALAFGNEPGAQRESLRNFHKQLEVTGDMQ